MLTSRTCRLALLTLLAAVGVAASLAPVASAAAQRYASPTGAGTACSAASPCSITQAVGSASSGDEVIVKSGDYPLTATLTDGKQITIHGVVGQPRPRLLFSGAGQEGIRVTHASTLRYVEVDQASHTDANALFASDSSTVDQVIAKASGAGVTATIQNSTFRNSIVAATGANGRAIETSASGGSNTSTYRNVTAIATGSGGVAIEAYAAFGAAGNVTVHTTNVIARGGPGGVSLKAHTDWSGAQAKIIATHSNYGTVSTAGSNTAVTSGGGNQGYPPAFVNPAAGDYRQAAGSATIGAGVNDPINGAFDVDGDPRRIGTTDIGADEFVVPPAASTIAAGAVTDRSATLSGSVDPKDAPTSYHFEYGPTTGYGSTSPATGAGSGTGAVAAAAALGGLSAATTYHYRVVASNAGGVTKGTDQTFTTAAPTPTPPTPPVTPPTLPPTTPTPTPGFAGVKLVSTRLTVAGSFITLRLSCPTVTVGRCSGRTKLSARQRRTSSRAAARVSLGRATFSIAAGKRAKLRLRVTRAGRRLLSRARRLRGRASSAARNGVGQSKTTAAAVTIRRRHR